MAACVLGAVLALAFLMIEGFLLISGDWKLFENSTLALVQLCLKCLFALFALGISLLAIARKNRCFIWAGLCMLAASLACVPFMSNGLGWCFAAVSALFILSEECVWRPFMRHEAAKQK